MIKVRVIAIVSATVRIVIVAFADIGIGTALCLFCLHKMTAAGVTTCCCFHTYYIYSSKSFFRVRKRIFFITAGRNGTRG